MTALAINGQLQPDAPGSAAQLLREAPRGAYTAATFLPGIGVRHYRFLPLHARRDAVSAGGFCGNACAGARLGPALRAPCRVAPAAEQCGRRELAACFGRVV